MVKLTLMDRVFMLYLHTHIHTHTHTHTVLYELENTTVTFGSLYKLRKLWGKFWKEKKVREWKRGMDGKEKEDGEKDVEKKYKVSHQQFYRLL